MPNAQLSSQSFFKPALLAAALLCGTFFSKVRLRGHLSANLDPHRSMLSNVHHGKLACLVTTACDVSCSVHRASFEASVGVSARSLVHKQRGIVTLCEMELALLLQVWYAIAPGENRQRFESFARTLYPNDAKSCSNFLRHKSCMITPKLIRDEGIPLVSVSAAPDLLT